jgi:hypothetical protein
MRKRKMALAYGLVGLFVAFSLLSCVSLKNLVVPPKLTVTPSETVLSPALIKKPVTFTGSGFEPKELVSVEMILPPDVKVKGIDEGQNVGLAFGNADDKGNFEAKIGAVTVLNSFFQVEWKSNLSPDFKQASPIPPRTYKIMATGMNSGLIGKTTLTLLPPPKKK